jgi:hypothetical protein
MYRQTAAVVALQLIEMGRTELEVLLKTSNSLHAIARKVFERRYVDSIVYSVPLISQRNAASLIQYEVTAPALVLYNSSPEYVSPEARNLFSDN